MATVQIDGLRELMEALRNLPQHLVEEAAPIVEGAARRAFTDIGDAYPPEHSGKLRRGLKLTQEPGGRFGVLFVVKNTAKHASLIENGTQARHTGRGWNRGAMPPQHLQIPRAMRARAQMYRDLKSMLEREGFVVTGNA